MRLHALGHLALGSLEECLLAARPQRAKPNFGPAAWLLLLEKIPWFGLAYLDSYITVYGQNKGVALNSFEGLPLGAAS